MAENAKFALRHDHRGWNVIRHIPRPVFDPPNLDLLHTMQIGMLDNLQKSVFQFMKMYKLLDMYNEIWLCLPDYPGLTPKIKSYEEVSQWNG